MKYSLLVLPIVLGVTIAARYDNLDVEQVLSNDRVLSSYINCLLEKGPCTPELRELREHAPKAVSTGCKDCTADQKKFIRKAARFVIKNKPDQWVLLAKKYDPNGEYKDTWGKFMREDDK